MPPQPGRLFTHRQTRQPAKLRVRACRVRIIINERRPGRHPYANVDRSHQPLISRSTVQIIGAIAIVIHVDEAVRTAIRATGVGTRKDVNCIQVPAPSDFTTPAEPGNDAGEPKGAAPHHGCGDHALTGSRGIKIDVPAVLILQFRERLPSSRRATVLIHARLHYLSVSQVVTVKVPDFVFPRVIDNGIQGLNLSTFKVTGNHIATGAEHNEDPAPTRGAGISGQGDSRGDRLRITTGIRRPEEWARCVSGHGGSAPLTDIIGTTDVKLPNISFQIAGVYHVCGAVAVQIGGPHLAQPVPSAGVHSDLADKPTGFRITDKQCRAASGAIITISINRQQPSIITAPDQRSAQDIARVPLDFTNSVTLESFVPTDDLA